MCQLPLFLSCLTIFKYIIICLYCHPSPDCTLNKLMDCLFLNFSNQSKFCYCTPKCTDSMVKIERKTKLVLTLIFLNNYISSSCLLAIRESADRLILSHLISNNVITCKTPFSSSTSFSLPCTPGFLDSSRNKKMPSLIQGRKW